MINSLKDAYILKNSTDCMYDTNYGFNTVFNENGDVSGWDVYNDVYLYGSWNKVLFGFSLGTSCFIGRQDPIIPIQANDYYNLNFMMLLAANEHKYKPFPTKGKVQWQTTADNTWTDTKSAEFEITSIGDWQLYTINMAEYQYWVGNISNIRIYPFLDGYADIQFVFKYIRVISYSNFKCLNTQCSYYGSYCHPCNGVGAFGSITAGSCSTHYTTISGVSDTLLVNIDGYGAEQICLGTNINITGTQMAKIINDKLSRIDLGGYSHSFVEHTEENKLKIQSGSLGISDDNLITYGGAFAIFIKANLLKPVSYFINLDLTIDEPLPGLYIISGDISNIFLLFYIHSYDADVMSVEESLEYLGIFNNIIFIKFSDFLNIVTVKAYDSYSSDSVGYIPVRTPVATDMFIMGGMVPYTTSTWIGYRPNYLMDVDNNDYLILNPTTDTFLSAPTLWEVNDTSYILINLKYAKIKATFVSIGAASTFSVDTANCTGSYKYSSYNNETIEPITDAFVKSFFPYTGFYEPYTVTVDGGTAKDVLGFNNNSLYVYSKKPASGFEPSAARKLKYYEINRLVDSSSVKTAYRQNPYSRVVEAGRSDFYESNNPDYYIKLGSPDFYTYLNGEGRIIVDFTHPVSNCGFINHIKVNGLKYDGYVASMLIFRRFKTGQLVKLYEFNILDEVTTSVYTGSGLTFSIDTGSAAVVKGDLIGFKNLGLLCPHSSVTQSPNASVYSFSSSTNVDVKFYPGNILSKGAIGPSYYAYSDRRQDSVKLLVDMGKRSNIGSINIYGKELDNKFEYNIAACLDVNWQCKLYGNKHSHSAVHSTTGITYYWTHDNIAYGIDSLKDCKTTVDGGKQGDSVGKDSNGLATYGEHSYFYVNGDAEWLYGKTSDTSEFWYPYGGAITYDYEYDPVSIYINFPHNKSTTINKSAIYFKESDNFKQMSLLYYMGPTGEAGNSAENGYFLIPSFNNVILDGAIYSPPLEGSDDVTLSDYLFPNPMPNSKLSFIDGGATNEALYKVANNARWNIMEHCFNDIECYGFMVYCNHHKSTKIIEMELYGSIPMGSSLTSNIDIISSMYGDYWDYLKFSFDSIDSNKVVADVFSAPRYFEIEILPQSEFELYEISFNSSESDLKTLNCDNSLSIDDAPKGKMSSVKEIILENTYDVPLNLNIDIPINSVKTDNILSWVRMDSEETTVYAEVGPGALVEKNSSFPIQLYDSQIAINCPCYYLNNLIDGKQAWVYEKNNYWRKFSVLQANSPINYYNDPDIFCASFSFDLVSNLYWQIDVEENTSHVLYNVNCFNGEDKVSVKNVYIQVNRGLNRKRVKAALDENGSLTATSVIEDDFSNNTFEDYWQYSIPSGSYAIEGSYGFAPSVLLPDAECSISKYSGVYLDSFEFSTEFTFGPFLEDESVSYIVGLYDSYNIRTAWLEIKKIGWYVYLGIYIINPDKDYEYASTYTDHTLLYRTIMPSELVGYGNNFVFEIHKQHDTLNVVKLYCKDTETVIFNYGPEHTLFSSCISDVKITYKNNNSSAIYLPQDAVIITHHCKSFIIDIDDNWGNSTYMGIGNIRFIDEYGSVVPVTGSYIDVDSTSVQSTYYHDDTFMFTSTSYTGSSNFQSWVSGVNSVTNQRVICRFSIERVISEIHLYNYHHAGFDTDKGIKNYKIYTSLSDEFITDYPYGVLSADMKLISSGIAERHADSDVAQYQVLTLSDDVDDLNVKARYFNNRIAQLATKNVSLKALPVLSENESIIVEVSDGDPIDKIVATVNNTDFTYVSLYTVSVIGDRTLWATNASTRYLIEDSDEAVYSSGWFRTSYPYYSHFYPKYALSTTSVYPWSGYCFWMDKSELPIWWVYDFGAGKEANPDSLYILFTNYGVTTGPSPDTVQIFGSNDVEVSPVDKVKTIIYTGVLDWSSEPVVNINLDFPDFYRYYGVIFQDSSGSTEEFMVGIRLFRFYWSPTTNIIGGSSSDITVTNYTFNNYLAIDLGKRHVLDFIRHYGSASGKVSTATSFNYENLSSTNTDDVNSVVWGANLTFARWLRIPILSGDNTVRMVNYLGVYPNIAYAYTCDGNKNCEWVGIGNLLTNYSDKRESLVNTDTVILYDSSDYFSNWSPSNCLLIDKTLVGYENCWGYVDRSDGLFPHFVLDFGLAKDVTGFLIVHCYNDIDTSTWQNVDYNIYGKKYLEDDFSLLFAITGNSSLSREHSLNSVVQLRYIKLEIVNYIKPTTPMRIYDSYNNAYSYFDGGFVRHFEVIVNNVDYINSEEHPIVCINLNKAYNITGHSLFNNTQIDDTDWDNSEDFFKYSDSVSNDPSCVSFLDSPGIKTVYSYDSSLVTQELDATYLFIASNIYLSTGGYTVSWESYGAVNSGMLNLKISGDSTFNLYSESIAVGWTSQVNYVTVVYSGYYVITCNVSLAGAENWGIRNINFKKNESNSRWVSLCRNTATDYSWDYSTDKKGKDYLSRVKIYAADKFRPTENYNWWSSNFSTLSNDVVNTKIGSASLKIDFPASFNRESIVFNEGDHFGWDCNWSIKDALCFWFYISDIDKISLNNSGFILGATNVGDDIKFTDPFGNSTTVYSKIGVYAWLFEDIGLTTGWNDVRLNFDRNTFSYPEVSETTGFFDEALNFSCNYFKSFGVNCSGIGDSLYMLLDGLRIERNTFDDDMVNGGKGLCLTHNECVLLPVGGLNLREGTVELWVSLYSDTYGTDVFGNRASRSIFSITNNNDEALSVIIKSGSWFELGVGDAKNNFNTYNIDPYNYDFSTLGCSINKPFHLALSWSNDGRGTDNGDTLRLYINNILMISTNIGWEVGDSISANFVLGGASTILSGNNDLEGSAVFSNLMIYDYCKDNFNIRNFDSEEVSIKNNNELIQISIDNTNFYDINAGKLPLTIEGVPSGDKVSFFVKVDKSKMYLIDRLSGLIEVEWEVIV